MGGWGGYKSIDFFFYKSKDLNGEKKNNNK